jgi:hypothetical protein
MYAWFIAMGLNCIGFQCAENFNIFDMILNFSTVDNRNVAFVNIILHNFAFVNIILRNIAFVNIMLQVISYVETYHKHSVSLDYNISYPRHIPEIGTWPNN